MTFGSGESEDVTRVYEILLSNIVAKESQKIHYDADWKFMVRSNQPYPVNQLSLILTNQLQNRGSLEPNACRLREFTVLRYDCVGFWILFPGR